MDDTGMDDAGGTAGTTAGGAPVPESGATAGGAEVRSPEGRFTAAPGLAAVLLPRMAEMAAETASRLTADIPAYRLLPDSVLGGDLVANTEAVLKLFFTTVAEGRAPTEAELAAPVAWGAERARDGVPLEAVLRVYPLGARRAWELAAAGPDPVADPYALVTGLLAFLGEVMPKVAEAYLREQADLDWEQREHGRNLAGVLLAGRPARRAAERYGRTLAERYEVVVLRLPEAPGGATNRILRALRSELDGNPEVLATFKGEGGVLLVPLGPLGPHAPADPTGPAAAPDGATRRLLARLDTAAALRCTAAAAVAEDHGSIPRAQAEASEVLSLAEDLGRPPGLYRLADLAVEYQLVQPGPARDALARVLAPLEDQPHLIATLREFIAAGYRRADAAEALTVHRNTLTYRLGRIRLLTGHDATDPTGARHLAAALTAYGAARRPGA
ncbi:helix-turn-helix domain-containing protein [Streptomyces sp. NBC_01264]|uniref:helix-turn-helix domain-containing protein n=1 Tax=Streptomyces sp. NBC_01264 TaxID=2903804 RepID=UPI00224E33F7|nr:helix-turn-helix domain-containing protein [Streptomyces sp. NBC_01264]MCX4775732.1 helix-turn-helix domain-containing protein [Streptomyces sp. NBC_01264]